MLWQTVRHGPQSSVLRACLATDCYRIATNVGLDMLKGRNRRALPTSVAPPPAGRYGPDATSRALADGWRSSVAKGLEHQYAAFVQAA
jgi:hypothetical protein